MKLSFLIVLILLTIDAVFAIIIVIYEVLKHTETDFGEGKFYVHRSNLICLTFPSNILSCITLHVCVELYSGTLTSLRFVC